MATANILQAAVGRSCYWVPDYGGGLAFLKPQPGRAISVGPRIVLNQTDSADQTLALSGNVSVAVSLGAINPGSWLSPLQNQAVLFEAMAFAISPRDTSAKLQIASANITNPGANPAVALETAFPIMPIPFTFPPISGYSVSIVAASPPVVLFGGAFTNNANGPTAFFNLVNTDATAAHTYRRTCTLYLRVVDNIDPSAGPSIPGAGVSGEFS